MLPAAVVALYLPALVWVAVGLGLIAAYRWSAPRWVLRLAAAFLGLWALFATTVLVWVLTNGGYTAIVTLAHDPLAIFEPRWAPLWALGALGAFAVFAVAFTVNQLVGRGFLFLLHPTPMTWPRSLPRAPAAVRLLCFNSPRPEAFSFTLLASDPTRRLRPRRAELILLSDALVALLTPEELEAAVAHEVGHIGDLDGRYLTFFRTLARMMRWDPVLAFLADSLSRREEYIADDAAVALTGRPLALARALFKVSTLPVRPVPLGLTGFLGTGGPRGAAETLRRIQRLVARAEATTGAGAEGA
jgi:Zn-dependent protease with chaperone function